MASIFTNLIKDFEEAKQNADERTKNWLLVDNNPVPVWILTGLYILTVFLGPRFMKNREAFQLKWFMVVYNLGLVALSLYMFVEIVLSAWDANYDYICAVYNAKTRQDPKEYRVACVLWWYFFSKAIELNDTVLMILRKKSRQISFLHVFHHATMLNIWWWVMMFIPTGQSYFGASLNCLVHVVMYSYYGLSVFPSLREKMWWKHYITRFQLIQFVITLSHTLNGIRRGCDFPKWGQYLLAGYMIFMLILFMNFYIKAYVSKRKPSKHLNGTTQNNNGVSANGQAHSGEKKKN